MKDRIEKIIYIIFIIFGISFGIYKFFEFWNPANGIVVEAFANETDYPVYSGRNVYEWWKSTLTENQQILYDEMKESYLQFRDSFSTQLNELTTDEIEEVCNAIMTDHPEIFWSNKYKYSIITRFKKNYDKSKNRT